jgi:hypothetical protein
MEKLGKAMPRLLLIGALALALACAGGGGDKTAACRPAGAKVVAAIETGLTVSGGGSLTDAKSVLTGSDGFTQLIAARIVGTGLTDTVGVWATGDTGAPIVALDAYAKEFSDWGVDISPNSPVGATRESLRLSDEYDAVRNCV